MSDFLSELIVLCRDSIEVRALLREFLDSDRIIACAQIDHRATEATPDVVVDCQPSNDFRSALAALLAKDGECDQATVHDEPLQL
jgi:hypothetical protein